MQNFYSVGKIYIASALLYCWAGAVLGKNIWGTWPLIIWEATMAKRNLSEITIEPINSTSSRTTVPKNLGEGLGKIGGGCAPWPQRRTATAVGDYLYLLFGSSLMT